MTKMILDNGGVLVKHKSPSSIKRSVPSQFVVPTNLASSITTDFIREMKTELVQELASILAKAGLVAVTNILHKPDEISNESVTIAKPVTIDESVVVTKVSVGQVQKGFEKLTETQTTTDENVSSSIDKLRLMKKGN